MKTMRPIEEQWIWKSFLRAERSILIFTSSASTLIIFAGVIMRYFLKTDLFGIEELITILVMWLYFIGSGHGSYEDSHIKADMMSSFIKNKQLLKVLNICIYGISTVLISIITAWGIQYAIWSISAGGVTTGWRFPLIISQIPISIGFLLMLFYSLYHLIRTIRPLKKDKEDTK